MEIKPAKPRLITPVIAWFLGTMILANTASRMAFILLPVYLADELGASVSQVGLVFVLANIVPMVLQIFGGWLSDTIGRLRTIAIGASVACFGYFGFAFAPTWEWVILALMFEYVSGAMVGPSFGAFIADNSSDENRAKVFGLVTSIFHVVGIVGPPLGGFIAFRYGYKPMFMTAAIMYFLAAIGRIWMANNPEFEVKKHEEVGEHLTLDNLKENLLIMLKLVLGGGILTWIFITDGIRDITFSISDQFEPLYLAKIGNMNEEQIGLMSSIFNIALTLSLAPAGWLAAKISERKAIVLGYIIQCFAFAIFLKAATFSAFAVSWFLLGAGFGIMDPSFESLISKVVPEKNRGLAYGLFFTSISLLALPAPYFGGHLWERFTPRTPFIITAIFTAVVIIPVWFKFKLPQKSEEVQVPV